MHYNQAIYDATGDNKNTLSSSNANQSINLETNLSPIDASIVNSIAPVAAGGWFYRLVPTADQLTFYRIEYNVNVQSNATGSETIILKVHNDGKSSDLYTDQLSLPAGSYYVFTGEFIAQLSNTDALTLTIESSANNSILTINQFNFRAAKYTTGVVHGGDDWNGFNQG